MRDNITNVDFSRDADNVAIEPLYVIDAGMY